MDRLLPWHRSARDTRNAVAEVWIVGLTVDEVIVHGDPEPAMQRRRISFKVGPQGDLDIAGLPGTRLPAGPLFRPPPLGNPDT